MVSLSGKRTNNGVNDFAKAMEPYWTSFDAGNPVAVDKKREAAQKQLEECKQSLVGIGFQVDCLQVEDGLIEMVLRTQFGRKVNSFDGVREVRAFPVTKSSSTAQVLELPGKSWPLSRQGTESVTGLVAFEIHSSEENLTECFVLNLPVNGLPADRNEQILASLIANRSAFMRFLAMLLQDSSSEADGVVGALVSPIATILKSNGFGKMPLAESLLKAYCRSPSILKEISRVIAAADRVSVNVVPSDFRQLWAGFAPLVRDVK
jgi:hypothetical protein